MKKEYGMAAFTIFCWSTMAPVSKLLLGGLSNMEVLCYGSAVAAVVLFLVILFQGKWEMLLQYTCGDYLKLICIGFFGYFLYSSFYYYGLSVLTSQTACILHYLWPLFTVCFSCLLLRERFSAGKLVALLLSFAGVAVVVFHPGEAGAAAGAGTSTGVGTVTGAGVIAEAVGTAAEIRILGYLSCILAAGLYGSFNVLNKKKGGDPLINMFLYLTVGAVCAFFCCLFGGWELPAAMTPGQIAGLLWLGIFINAAGFLLWAMALQGTDAAAIANFAYATPVVSLLFSYILLNEPLHLTSFAGLFLILAGVFLQLWEEKHVG